MAKIEDIENAVVQLSPAELAQFRLWFEEFDAARFDERIERDIKDGKLEKLAEEAVRTFHKGNARSL